MELKYGDTHCELTIQHIGFETIIGGSFQTLQFTPSRPSSHFSIVHRKMKMHNRFLPIGNTSQRREEILLDFETEVPLFVTSVIGVHIDPNTRRPAPFPQSVKEYFTQERCGKRIVTQRKIEDRCLRKFNFTPVDGKFHVWECIVTFQQIDHNNHLNQAVYADICYDRLGDAFAKSIFGQTGRLLERNIRRMSVLFLHEVLLGDKLVTTVWEDEQQPLIYKFHVRNGALAACQVEIELYETKFTVKSNL